MSTFICEKCGCIDNSALENNYWLANLYIGLLERKKLDDFSISFSEEYQFYNDHYCCSECCKNIPFNDGSGVINNKGWHNRFPKKHWSEYGKEYIMNYYKENKGDFVNAERYFKMIGEDI